MKRVISRTRAVIALAAVLALGTPIASATPVTNSWKVTMTQCPGSCTGSRYCEWCQKSYPGTVQSRGAWIIHYACYKPDSGKRYWQWYDDWYCSITCNSWDSSCGMWLGQWTEYPQAHQYVWGESTPCTVDPPQ